NVDLAERVGISAPPCLRRVRALEEAGFIKGYHADIASDKLGFGIVVFVKISLNNHSENDLMNFSKLVEKWSQVRECYMMTGDADYMIKVVAEDWDSFQRFLVRDLTGAPNVAQIKSMPIVQRTKYEPGVPVEDSKAAASIKE
ncbi:MAG: Lrp/AsnC family transcriptional regulator, partial [Alphaproteobacteria bacterium]|nr:Lrp/AsnC family transcriptional regulator [Alphaproteobacteria bacterium]